MEWNEERAGERLRTLMLDEDLPPIGSDVERARLVGRRDVGRRRLLAAGAGVMAVAAVSSVAVVALRQDTPPELVASDRHMVCQETRQFAPPPGYGGGSVTAADRSGRYVAGSAAVSGRQYEPVLWKDGKPTVINVPDREQMIASVNNRGDAVGGTWPFGGDDDQMPIWLYRDGRVRPLKTPDGLKRPQVAAINDRGDIVGSARDASDHSIAVLWPADALDRPRRLTAPADYAVTTAIDNDGTTVGSVGRLRTVAQKPPTVENEKPYLWTRGGRGRELQVPTGYDSGRALGIRDGWVLGYVYSEPGPDEWNPTEEMTPVRWRISNGNVEVLSEPMGRLSAVGQSGWLMSLTVPTGKAAPVLINVDGRIRRAQGPTFTKGSRGQDVPHVVFGEQAVWAKEEGNRLTVIANQSMELPVHRLTTWVCQL